MAEEQALQYDCHIFVCTNDRKGKKKSCADGNGTQIRALLKKEAKNRGWTGRVRVSTSGCLGLCMKGPNVVLYPQKIWFSDVGEADVPTIIERVGELMSTS
jgi:(2Fe-2S) ferredoxin